MIKAQKCLELGFVVLVMSVLMCVGLVGCGEDEASSSIGDSNSSGGDSNSANDLGSEPEPGPANEIDAQITSSDGSSTMVSGSAEDLTPESNQAVVDRGTLTVFLSASDGTLTTFAVDAPSDAIPGTVSITSEGATGTWLTIVSIEGVYTSSGGSITVKQCPEAGEVVTGTFDVELNDFSGGTSALTGTWRATVALSDNSITCRVIEPEPTPGGGMGGGTGDGTGDGTGGGTGGACELNPDNCDGPCCPFIEPVIGCQIECQEGPCNPVSSGFDASGAECVECVTACEDIYLDDPECSGPIVALEECSADSGCDELDRFEDEHLACVDANCCAELQTAF